MFFSIGILGVSRGCHLHYWDNALKERSAPSANGMADVGSSHVIVSRPVLHGNAVVLFTSTGSLLLVQLPSTTQVYTLYTRHASSIGHCPSIDFSSAIIFAVLHAHTHAHTHTHTRTHTHTHTHTHTQSSLLSVRALHGPQGLLFGLGRRMSSLFFGSSSSSSSDQTLVGRSIAVRNTLTGARLELYLFHILSFHFTLFSVFLCNFHFIVFCVYSVCSNSMDFSCFLITVTCLLL